MTSKQYEYLLTIANEGNLSRAAKRLGIALPYLSKQMQLIEKEIGVQILDHSTASTYLNDVGQELARGARLMLFRERLMRQKMTDSIDQRKGVLSVGMGSYRSTYMLPKILPQFYRKYKDTRIQLTEAGVEFMEPLVLEGKVDVAITIFPSRHRNVLNRFLGVEDLVLIVPPHYPIEVAAAGDKEQYPAIPFHQIRDLPFIFLASGTSLCQRAKVLMEREHFTPVSKIESKSLEAICNLVLEGVGAAIVPSTMINSDIFQENPQCFTLEGSNFQRNIYALYRADGYLSMACRELLSLFQQNLEDCTVNQPEP